MVRGGPMTARWRWFTALLGVSALTACSLGGGGVEEGETTGIDVGDPGDCAVVDMAVSPEKIALLTDLARTFNESEEARAGDRCVFVRPQVKSSGAAARLLFEENWDET